MGSRGIHVEGVGRDLSREEYKSVVRKVPEGIPDQGGGATSTEESGVGTV